MATMKAAVVLGKGKIKITHSFKLEEIEAAYELFGNQRDGVVKVAIRP